MSEILEALASLPIEDQAAFSRVWNNMLAPGRLKHGQPDPEAESDMRTIAIVFFVRGYAQAIEGEQKRFAVTRRAIEEEIAKAMEL